MLDLSVIAFVVFLAFITSYAVFFSKLVTCKRDALLTMVLFVVMPLFWRGSVSTLIHVVLWWLVVLAIAVFLWVCVVRFPQLPWRPPKKSAKSPSLGRKSKTTQETPNENTT